jgi:putative ABC transport system permease protein
MPDEPTADDWRQAILARLHAGEPTCDQEMVEEVSQHLQDRYDELRRVVGLSAADAFVAALAELDEETPAPAPIWRVTTRRLPMVERFSSIWQDARYAARTLRQAPLFSVVVILTLALGIGATTAIFSVVDAVLLRPFPYPDLDRLLVINERTRAGQQMSVSWLNFRDWHDQNQIFDALGIYRSQVVNLTGGDQPERLNASLASSEMFAALGIAPEAGRAFDAADDRPTAARIAIISDRLWRNRFDADPALIGKQVPLNGQAHTIVGIMPPAMRFPSRLTDVWLPLGLFVDTFPTTRGAHPRLTAIGKLKPGISAAQAEAHMDAIARRLEQQYPDSNRNVAMTMTPYYEMVVSNIRPALLVLLGAVALILLIACANLASLLLAKADRRQREIAVRAALGAGRWRLVRQLLTESLVLALAGGALGVLLAMWAVKMFIASGPTSVPRVDLIAVDWRVLAFATLVSVATGILFGLAPAFRGSSPDLLATLQAASRSATRGSRLTSSLVVLEIAMALVLLAAAGLTIKSFAQLMAVDTGFNPERVVTMRITLPDAKYPDRAQWTLFHQTLLDRVAALPVVDAAALNSALPLEGGGSESAVLAEGQPMPSPNGPPPNMCLFQATTVDYFKAMAVPILAGRVFTPQDTADSTRVAVVDDTLVRKLFPGQDPQGALGKRIAFEARGVPGHADFQPLWREIIGVVRHVRHYGLASEPPFVQIYAPMAQLPIYFEQRRPSMALFVRTRLDPEALVPSIRGVVASIDRDIPLYDVRPMSRLVSQATEQPRLSVTLLGGFGALALILAMLGIYGLLSYAVTERQREIGVRLAFGATRGDVLRLIVGRGMLLTGIGMVLGLAGAFAATRWLQTLLFGVSPYDPATFAIILGLLAVVAFLASYFPARKAMQVDPVVTLRYE